jgi:hypothetical protein
MTSSAIYSSGSLIRLENNTQVTGSLNVSAGITGSLFGTASNAVTASFAQTVTRYTRQHSYDNVISASVGKAYDYSGYAVAGALTSQAVWTITRLTITASGDVVARQTASNAIWNNTGSIVYS